MSMTYFDSTLAGVCSLVTDGTHDTPKSVETGFPLIKAKEIVGGQIDFATCEQISRADHLKVISRSKPEHGDTLFAHIGASLGEAAFVNTRCEFSIKNIALFKPNPHVIDGRYLNYCVLSSDFQDRIKAMRTGSAQPFLGLAQLRGFPIRIHRDIETQHRIASILSAYDDLIENNTRRIAILEEMARRFYEEWFVHFRFPGHEQVRMVESELGLIPEGWRVVKLGSLVSEIRDSVAPTAVDSDTPYVGLEHIPRRSIALSDWGRAADVQSSKLRFRRGDILFGKIRPYFHKVAVAPMGGVASSDAIVIRPNNADAFVPALATINSDAFVAHATQTSNGTKMPRANWNVLVEYPVLLPPHELRQQHNEFVTNSVASIRNLVMRNRNFRAQRDLLLPKLISGEIDVSAFPEAEAVAA